MAPSIDYDTITPDNIPIAPKSWDTITVYDFERDTALATLAKLKAEAKFIADLKTSPQDAVEPFTIIEGPVAWKGADLVKRPEEWIYQLTEQDKEELDAAIKQVQASGIDDEGKVIYVSKADFPLPTFGTKIKEIANEVSNGRGFTILRGVPVEKYNRLQLIILWWGIGQHVGRVLPINVFGHLINHIHDLGAETKGKRIRSPNTNIGQNFHSDQFATNIVGLLSIGKALKGGDSRWASGVTVHNELLRRGRKDLVEALTQNNWWIGRNGAHVEWETDGLTDELILNKYFTTVQPFYYGPDGRLHINFAGIGYILSQEKEIVPRLTPIQEEAIRTVQGIAQDPDIHLRLILQPGDVQLLDNITQFHTRDGFEDGEAPNEKRHLLRWWIDSRGKSPEELRAAGALPIFGERLVDPAGGWPLPEGTTHKIVLDTTDKSKAQFF